MSELTQVIGWPITFDKKPLSEDATNNSTHNFGNISLFSCPDECKFDMVSGSNSGDYGFIPLQQLGRFIDKGINNGLTMGYVDLHKLLSHRGIPNCIDGQFEISTGLNISLWEHLLQGNRNHQLKIFS